MIRRIILLFFIYIIAFILSVFPSNDIGNPIISCAFAQESLKINSINFDNSDSIIFLGTSGNSAVQGDFKVTKKVLTDPGRVFFDIENAVITFPNSTYNIKNSRLQKVKIAQNTTNPDVVRIVIWNSPNYDTSKLKVLKIKNNIIIKLDNDIPSQKYLTQIYRETKQSAVDYYDKTVIVEDKSSPKEGDEIFNKVQQAFKQDNQELVRPNIEQKQAKLKSRYFLDKISASNGNLVISGIGVINVEKPFVLTEPSRIVFNLPNTIVLQELRDKEIKLSETSSAKIGQFTPSTARVVIKTPSPYSYIPIYSSNLQTLMFADGNNLSSVRLNGEYTQLSYFKEQNVNASTDIINITFSNPIFYSLSRESNKISIIFYNLINFDTESFNAVALTKKTGFEAKKLASNVYKLTFPVKADSYVDCYETLNAKQLRFVFTHKAQDYVVEEKKITKSDETASSQVRIPIKTPEQMKKDKQDSLKAEKKLLKKEQQAIKKIKNKVIIIDPGHGGNDTGAYRGKVLEKNLTLEIASKVYKILVDKGFTNVIMTRKTDKTLTLQDRVDTANNNNADIFVSIHINASVKSEIHGMETHYYWDRSYKLAKVIHKELIPNVKAVDRGLFKSKFYVINHTEAPAVLLELGFISNEQERNSLTSEKRQSDSAKAIADGIINYLMEQ